MGKFLSLIIATYFLTAGTAAAVDTVYHPTCSLRVSDRLWDSTRHKYEDARTLLMAKGYALTRGPSDIAMEQIGRLEFQLRYFTYSSLDSSDETMLVQWEGHLENAPQCIKSCGSPTFINSKLPVHNPSSSCVQQAQCATQAPVTKQQQF